MAALDLGTGAVSVLAWVAGAMAAVVLAAAVLAWRHRRPSIIALAAGLALALAGAGLLVVLDQPRPEDRWAERQTFARRADELAARAFAPNSPLACLDAPAGPTVESACEALLFGRPEAIATAVSYVAAKLALLAFAQVANAARIKTNLREGTFDRLVARHAGAWPLGERAPAMTEAAPPKGAAAEVGTALPPTVAKPLSPGHDFPSAASIPPVSIMTPEPARPPEPADTRGDGPAVESAAPRKPPLPRAAPRPSPGSVSSAPARPAAPAASTETAGQN